MMSEQLYRSVKASERNPQAEGYYHTNIGCTEFKFIGDGVNGDGPNKKPMWLNLSGGHVTEWLEPYTPSLNAGSLEEAAMEYADKVVLKESGGIHISSNDFNESIKAAFLAGAAYVKGGEEKLKAQLEQVTNDMNTLGNMQCESMGWVVEKSKEIKKLKKEIQELQLAIDIRDAVLNTAGLSHNKMEKADKSKEANDICELKTSAVSQGPPLEPKSIDQNAVKCPGCGTVVTKWTVCDNCWDEFPKSMKKELTPSRPSLDIDKVVEQMREANPYNSKSEHDYDKIRWVAYQTAVAKLKELLNQSNGKGKE